VRVQSLYKTVQIAKSIAIPFIRSRLRKPVAASRILRFCPEGKAAADASSARLFHPGDRRENCGFGNWPPPSCREHGRRVLDRDDPLELLACAFRVAGKFRLARLGAVNRSAVLAEAAQRLDKSICS
jgi:hypothetical protein